jgi:DsbC/DsbD-like thiol-disulfide interchange protein
MVRGLTFLTILAAACPAAASSSTWSPNEGGAVRLVTSGLSDERGQLRGALEIDLKPGWKTYWRSPGDAGVPPQVMLSELSDATDAEILFPPPERITDAYATWAGYTRSVALPVLFSLGEPNAAGIIEGHVFLGVCDTICVPVEVPFSFDAGSAPYDAEDAAVVEDAFATLPVEAGGEFEVSDVSREGKHLRFRARLPEAADAPALFVAGPEEMQMTMPELEAQEGRTATFLAELLSDTADADDFLLHYTLVAGDAAVHGEIAVP